MTEFSFKDRDLRLAAAGARDAILAALPEPEACPADFSEGFHARMKPLLRQGAAWDARRKLRRRLIAALLALVLGAAAVAAFHPAVRAAVQKWFRETFSHSVVYRYTESAPPDAVLPEYTVGWLPEGYVLTDVYEDTVYRYLVYQNSEDQYIFIDFNYMFDGTISEMEWDSDLAYEFSQIEIHGCPAHLYIVPDQSCENDLLWFDDATGISFQISGFLSKDELIRIAENITI